MQTGYIPFFEVRERLRKFGAELQWSIVSDAYPASMRRPQPRVVRSSRNGRQFRYDLVHPVGRPSEPPARFYPEFIEAAHLAGGIAAKFAASPASQFLPLQPFGTFIAEPENLADAWIWLVHDFCWRGLIPTEAVVSFGIYSNDKSHTVSRSDINCPISVPCVEALLLLERMYSPNPPRLPPPCRPVLIYTLTTWPSQVRKGRDAGLIEVESIEPPARDDLEEFGRVRNFRRDTFEHEREWQIPLYRDDDRGAIYEVQEYYGPYYPWRRVAMTADGSGLYEHVNGGYEVPLPPRLRDWAKRLLDGDGIIQADDEWLRSMRAKTKESTLRSTLNKLSKLTSRFSKGMAVVQRNRAVCFGDYGLAEQMAEEENAMYDEAQRGG